MISWEFGCGFKLKVHIINSTRFEVYFISIKSWTQKVVDFTIVLLNSNSLKVCTQWAHFRRFAINLTSKFHVESSWKLHRFGKVKPPGNLTLIRSENFDVDSTFKIDKISMSSPHELCRFDAKSTQLLYSLFPFYHFLTFSVLWTYSKLFWYSAESL